jgi:hypothetical protein
MAARSLAGPTLRRPCRVTSERPQVDDVQYPRVPNKILKSTLIEEVVDDVIAGVAMSRVLSMMNPNIC